jgi:DNA-binding NarL/FixJ family response regulator
VDGGVPRGGPVLVVEDDDACRALIVTLLDRIGCVVLEASSGDEALAAAKAATPALVVLDVAIPGVTGYEVCQELRDAFGQSLPIVFVSGTRVETPDRVAGLLIGADDYIVKPFDPDELLARVRRLLLRNNPDATGIDRRRVGSSDGLATLTPREREVLGLLARGSDQQEIAATLFISPKTVATHIQHLLTKLDVHSRAQAVALAHREQLLDDEPLAALPVS